MMHSLTLISRFIYGISCVRDDESSEKGEKRPQQNEQRGETVEQQPVADLSATKRKDNTGPEGLLSTSKVPKRLSLDDGKWIREGSNKSNSQTVYIRIPFSVMSGNESLSITDTVVQNDGPTYKLIDRVPNLTEIRKRKSYALLYDNQTKNAAWVYEILNSETLKEEVTRDNDKFSVDQSIHPFYQASNEKYQNDYEQGHLAAAANHMWCQEALDDTFLMSNISPQHKDLNKGKWKSLEMECRRKVKNNPDEIRNVHVYSGPLYLPRGVVKYNEKDQAVPTHFFKVIIVELRDRVELECYKMPNEKLEDKPKERGELEYYKMPNKKVQDALDEYKVSIEEIERASGLIFRENSCSKGETDSDREITWTGEYGETCTFKTQVKISTPCSQ